jgi:EAL domain-containing protein (putative c-di-GMP-specific phosphodiesterase class I)
VQAPATIAAAFEHGELAIRLTDLMLDAVLHDMAAWLGMGFDPGRVAVNASAADLLQADFADHVLARLDQHGVPAQNFEIEVTESVFLGRGADQVARALDRFARGGVRIALDDFGTGFASLSHLKQYPVNVLKIDRSFVSHVDSDAGDAAIVDAVIKLGSSFRMEVVAEGVETAEQAALLLQHGCHIAQGYHYGRPQPAGSVLAARGAAPIAPKK